MSEAVKIVPAICTQCGGTVEVNRDEETASCPFCGATFVVEKAINNYNVRYAHIEHADNVNVDMKGAVKEVLDFVGNQIDEGKEERIERRKIQAEMEMKSRASFMKLAGIMFGGMFLFAAFAVVVMALTGGFNDDGQETAADGGSGIESYVSGGSLYTEVTGADILEWHYQKFDSAGTVLDYENNGVDSYTSCVSADDIEEDVRYVVYGAYNEDEFGTTEDDPSYYAVVRVEIEDNQITDASEPVIVDSLSEYNYE